MPAANALRIVIVEDDADTCANLSDILALDNFQVETAASLAEAAQRSDWSNVFAVILDRRLPDGQAEELLPRLKQIAPDAAIIIVTGYPDLEGALSCLRQGAADYILKPISPEELRATLGGIVERRRLTREKRRSEEAFRHLVEAAECMIVILRADRTICYFSPYAQELTGYSSEQSLGRDYFDLCLLAEDHGHMADVLDRVLSGQHIRGDERRVRCADGSLRWMLWSARRLEDYDGAPGMLAIGLDMTARKRAEERALQSERLAAIGEMVAGLAHESRNALQRSSACLEMLELEVEDRPEALDLVKRVHKAQHHLHHLYEEVRAYAAPINLQRQRCNLNELWRDTWANLSVARHGKSIVLCEPLSQPELSAEVDAFAVGQVFRNILENAIAACPEEGEVTIAGRPTQLNERQAVQISFSDNGPGLTDEQRRKIFEPFFTTKTKGTGLGMAIARRIIDAHGGKITVGDNPHQGAKIVVTLPCVSGP
ncbi:MAG: ATP-binding protein [Pirellulales bacterium]